ncbi:hypothetical protein Tco_0669694 [Tanacetum coccineum]
MCMCLKDHLDAQERKQYTSTLENAINFEYEILDAEVQENEATPLSDEEIALDAASQGTVASGSGGEEPEFDYDLMNYDGQLFEFRHKFKVLQFSKGSMEKEELLCSQGN